MRHGSDWLSLVYGEAGDPARRRAATRIVVRQTPSVIELGAEPGEVAVRVTIAPSDPSVRWALCVRDGDAPRPATDEDRVWWRIEPGTWQPMSEAVERVAEGRGRARLDLRLRRLSRGRARPLGLVAQALG